MYMYIYIYIYIYTHIFCPAWAGQCATCCLSPSQLTCHIICVIISQIQQLKHTRRTKTTKPPKATTCMLTCREREGEREREREGAMSLTSHALPQEFARCLYSVPV